jgi:hypothetical protein
MQKNITSLLVEQSTSAKISRQRSGHNCSNVPINMEILRSQLMQKGASMHHTNRWVAARETS